MESEKNHTNELTYKTEIDIEINKLTVTEWDSGGREIGRLISTIHTTICTVDS